MEQLSGRVAVITGAGSGIGRALALRMAAEGMRIVAADVEEQALVDTMMKLEHATSLVIDVSRSDDLVALADHAYATYGAVDVLCNNAGVFAGGFMWERPAADFEWTLAVNLWGILNGIRAFVPRMLAAGTEGHIVNTASMAGLCTNAYSGPYTISKFAALAASECLAHDLAAIGAPINVSTVVPGRVATRIAASSRNRPAQLAGVASDDAQFVEQMLAEATTHDAMEPDEAAELVIAAIREGTYLVPTRASYASQLRERCEALIERRLPPMPAFD
jgi:NAD(P)-dependent dehydrogenase (short-subunit alcohol dehydrogenase family)